MPAGAGGQRFEAGGSQEAFEAFIVAMAGPGTLLLLEKQTDGWPAVYDLFFDAIIAVRQAWTLGESTGFERSFDSFTSFAQDASIHVGFRPSLGLCSFLCLRVGSGLVAVQLGFDSLGPMLGHLLPRLRKTKLQLWLELVPASIAAKGRIRSSAGH